jgi:hypothetical protein
MLQVKRLIRPNRRSGKALPPGGVSVWKGMNVKIVNTGKETLYVDSVAPRRKKRKARK